MRTFRDGVDYYGIFDAYYEWVTRTMQPSSSHPLFYGLRLKYLDRIKDDFDKKDTLCSEERPWINAAMGVKDFNGVVNYFCERSGLDAEKYTAMSFKLYSTPQVWLLFVGFFFFKIKT